MTYPGGEDMLAGLDPTPEERLEFLRVLDEVDAEEAAGLDSDADPDPDLAGDAGDYGPWDDQLDDLTAIGETLDQRHGLDGIRRWGTTSAAG